MVPPVGSKRAPSLSYDALFVSMLVNFGSNVGFWSFVRLLAAFSNLW